MADNAEPLADQAATRMEAAAHTAAVTTESTAAAANQDITNVVHQTGQSGIKATTDISIVMEDVAIDAAVRLLPLIHMFSFSCRLSVAVDCWPPRHAAGRAC